MSGSGMFLFFHSPVPHSFDNNPANPAPGEAAQTSNIAFWCFIHNFYGRIYPDIPGFTRSWGAGLLDYWIGGLLWVRFIIFWWDLVG